MKRRTGLMSINAKQGAELHGGVASKRTRAAPVDYTEKASILARLRKIAPTATLYLRTSGILEELCLSMEQGAFYCAKSAADLSREGLGDPAVLHKALRLLKDAGAIKRVAFGGITRIAVSPRLIFWGSPRDRAELTVRFDELSSS